jgi:hypothetical protein
MKKALAITLFVMSSLVAFSDDPPPSPPPGCPGEGETATVGGNYEGVPIEDGLPILLGLALLYISRKVYIIRKGEIAE